MTLRKELVERHRIVDQRPEFIDLPVLVDMEDLGPELLEPAVLALVVIPHEDDHVDVDAERAKARNDPAEEGQHRLLAAVGTRPGDGAYFRCLIAARIQVAVGDSGGAVLVRGIPAGVTSRSFGGLLGFTPLAEGLAQLGLELCTTPDCDLVAPSPAASEPPR